MRKSILFLSFFTICSALFAEENPKWIRKNSISPDGNTIAFVFQGDIWTVDTSGGHAVRLTSGSYSESNPIWTPDGKNIVFSSENEGNQCVWTIPFQGGKATKITTWPNGARPLAVGPNGSIYFIANIHPSKEWIGFPGTPQLYRTIPGFTKPELVMSLPVRNISIREDGTMLFEDYKGVEDEFRKHHKSSVTRDIWSWTPSSGSFRKLTSFEGEDRNPVYTAKGDAFYYLSEQGGNCFNVWKANADGSEARKITNFDKHPVRYLSASKDGTLSFSWNGELYTMKEGKEPQKVQIFAAKDFAPADSVKSTSFKPRGFAAAQGGKEIAVCANGRVYASAVEAGITHLVSGAPGQSRNPSFSKDGRTLYYDAERDGEWGIWCSSLKNSDDKFFATAYEFIEKRFTDPGQTCFQPKVSPDGKWVAFLRDRTELVIKNTSSKKEKSLLKGVNYSYTDGDIEFEWSPDSQYLLSTYQGEGGWNNSDIALIEIESGKMTNITRSGYTDSNFRWALGGKAMTWQSDRAGYRSHGSWGAEEDIYIMFFDAEAYNNFKKNEAEEKIEKILKPEPKKGAKKGKDETKKDSTKVEKLILDLDHIEDRTIRLTPSSGRMASYILSPDGDKLFYSVKLEKNNDLCCLDLKTRSIKVVQKGFRASIQASPDGKTAYTVGSSVGKMDLKTGSSKAIEFKGEFFRKPAEERRYIFEHCWKQVAEKFYDPAIHGLDWKSIHDNYEQFLPWIDNNDDFQELLSEMLGELNGSHTGARYYSLLGLFGVSTGKLGVLYDETYGGDGLKVAEVLPGSVLQCVFPKIKEGDIITSVNNKKIVAGTPWWEALMYTSGKRTQLGIKAGGKGKEEIVFIYPASSDSDALYKRWVRRNEEIVARLSGGEVGYVHVKKMDSDSFREVYSKALGKYRACKALVVDTRHNHGGWLHDDLATFLNGKRYIDYTPRGQYIGSEPFSKWTKPSIVLIGEDNYSDACGFPYIYRTLGIGKLLGAPVPGTMTAVWWESQIDPTIVFGIPQVTNKSVSEGMALENFQIEPDIPVQNTPEEMLRGEDRQLEAAVKEMLKTIEK